MSLNAAALLLAFLSGANAAFLLRGPAQVAAAVTNSTALMDMGDVAKSPQTCGQAGVDGTILGNPTDACTACCKSYPAESTCSCGGCGGGGGTNSKCWTIGKPAKPFACPSCVR